LLFLFLFAVIGWQHPVSAADCFQDEVALTEEEQKRCEQIEQAIRERYGLEEPEEREVIAVSYEIGFSYSDRAAYWVELFRYFPFVHTFLL
jgi:hypothetical protein